MWQIPVWLPNINHFVFTYLCRSILESWECFIQLAHMGIDGSPWFSFYQESSWSQQICIRLDSSGRKAYAMVHWETNWWGDCGRPEEVSWGLQRLGKGTQVCQMDSQRMALHPTPSVSNWNILLLVPMENGFRDWQEVYSAKANDFEEGSVMQDRYIASYTSI